MTCFETLDVVGVQKHEIRLEKDTMQEGSFKSSKDSPLRFPAAVPDPLGLCGSNHFQPCNLLSCQMGGLMQKNMIQNCGHTGSQFDSHQFCVRVW